MTLTNEMTEVPRSPGLGAGPRAPGRISCSLAMFRSPERFYKLFGERTRCVLVLHWAQSNSGAAAGALCRYSHIVAGAGTRLG